MLKYIDPGLSKYLCSICVDKSADVQYGGSSRPAEAGAGDQDRGGGAKGGRNPAQAYHRLRGTYVY